MSKKAFKQFKSKVDYPQIEKDILNYWDDHKIFERSITSRPDNKSFTFYEGPPTANGKPGIHHVMARTLKDLVCRYKTLQGFQVHRKAGWDTHGLPVEIEVEKNLGITNKSEIPIFGVEKYNAACKESVFTYKDVWEQMTRRMGYWINLEDAYVTCTNEYIESVWWALKTLFDKGLIYKDYKIVPQCPKSETVLSSHELALGYRETTDPSVYVMMRLKPNDKIDAENTYFLVWTTTPWTLISNVGLAVGTNITYVLAKTSSRSLILAKERLHVIKDEYEIVQEFKGSDLAGLEYTQLFDYLTVDKKGFFVVEGDFVSTDDGSGIVHIAPAFGADDYEISKKYNLPFLQPVTRGGKFTEEITDFAGQFVKDADNGIIRKLKEEGKLFLRENIVHSYPFSWRFDNVPVIYYARESWFIRTTSIAQRLVELNKTINWYPPEVGSGRFGNWLEENKDWALSRDRFWATPLPIWLSPDGDMFAIGSIEELKQGFVEKNGNRIPVSELDAIDLHKPFVDDIKFEKNGKIYTRTPELIDVWFDSGAMPFAQYHYPFENKELFESNFPSDFICEGIDQTRGWFYTLHAISTMLFDKVAYKNLIVNELILDKKGLKMSKSKGNTVNPFDLFERYGADSTRWYLVTTSPPWRPTLFNEDGLAEVQRKFFGTLTNTYNFFALYANLDSFTFEQEIITYDQRPEFDRWIISKLNALVSDYQEMMDNYDVTRAARAVSDFTIDQLSNWYVRRSRRRFWKSEVNKAKLSAYQTLYECLMTIAKLTSPFAPFISEEIFRNLNEISGRESTDSVHLSFIPKSDYREKSLEAKMELAQRIVYVARAMRAKNNLKVRQPLKKIMVLVEKEMQDVLPEIADIILEEINIKELEILTDDSGVVKKSAKANFKALGPKYGPLMKQLANAVKDFTPLQLGILEKSGVLELEIENQRIELLKEEVEIINNQIEGWVVETEQNVTVALDTELTENLIAESYAREFVNRIQNMRKESGLDVVDRIHINYYAPNQLIEYITIFGDYIKNETLAVSLRPVTESGADFQNWQLDDYECAINIVKSDVFNVEE